MIPARCPDCAAPVVDQDLTHAATCPLGLGIDDVTAADAAWFETHPHAGYYHRDVTGWEVADLRLFGVLPDLPGWGVGRVRVTRVKPGVRQRDFGGGWAVLDREAS